VGRHPEPPGPFAPQILALLLAGHQQAQIAAELHLALHSVSHYCRRLQRVHGAATVPLMLAGIWSARVAALEARVARLEQGERRRGVAERRAPPGVD